MSLEPATALADLLTRARQCMAQGRGQDAKALCQQALRLTPRHLPGLMLMGGIEGAAGNFKAARKAFEQALDLAPADPMVHFNLGLCNQHLKRPAEARRRYEQAIALNPEFAEAHSNLAATLAGIGRGTEAIAHYREALRLKPGLASASNNLGILLVEAGQNEEAQACFAQALATEPNFAEALNNLGSVLLARGMADQAIAPLQKAVALRPGYAEAHQSLGRAFQQLGRIPDAIACFERCLKARPDDPATLVQYGQALAESGKSAAALACFERAIALGDDANEALYAMTALLRGLDPALGPAALGNLAGSVERCLAARFNDHQSLAGIALEIVFTPEIRQRIEDEFSWAATRGGKIGLGEPVIAEIVAKPLFRLAMQRVIAADLYVERFLTRLRRSLLFAIGANGVAAAHRSLAADLAHLMASQAFLNEYVWAVDEAETTGLEAVRAKALALAPADPDFELLVLILACYRRLGEGDWPAGWLNAVKASASKRLKDIHRIEVETPAIEAELAAAMPAVTEIAAGTSRLVQTQYEAYPYPRWQSLPRTKPVTFLAHLRQAIWPHRPLALAEIAAPHILIAGCGTGHQAVLAATRYKNASILAIDLSRASLAYAKRMADAFGVTNIRFAQGDILDIDRIGETFDVVECVGVLHHMAMPATGLARIVGATRPGGLVRVGLYSATARRDLETLRRRLDVGAARVESAAEIRALRAQVIDLVAEGFEPDILGTLDFYSTSMVKDLLFHVCEHAFTIPRLAALFDGAGLSFLGFDIPDRRIKQAYLARNPGDPGAIDLNAWQDFETDHPKTFRGMYVAWLRRSEAA